MFLTDYKTYNSMGLYRGGDFRNTCSRRTGDPNRRIEEGGAVRNRKNPGGQVTAELGGRMVVGEDTDREGYLRDEVPDRNLGSRMTIGSQGERSRENDKGGSFRD